MRNILIFFLVVGCSSKFTILFNARNSVNEGDFPKAEKLYKTFLKNIQDQNSEEYVYYKLELCDLYIKILDFTKTKECLLSLKERSEYKFLISPKIKRFIITLADQKGKLEAVSAIKDFLSYDEEYLEGVYDYIVKNY